MFELGVALEFSIFRDFVLLVMDVNGSLGAAVCEQSLLVLHPVQVELFESRCVVVDETHFGA